MNISSTNNAPSIFGQVSTANVSTKPTVSIKAPVRPADTNKAQEQLPNKHATPNIVIDEQAIVQYKSNQASQLANSQPRNETSFSASHDQPSAKNETAIAQYQAIGNLSARESVQKLFGVDLMA